MIPVGRANGSRGKFHAWKGYNTMNSILRYTAAGLALATVGIASNASAATASASADAVILAPLSVSLQSGSLNFGNVAESGSGGTVTLSTAAVKSCTVGLLCTGSATVPTFHILGAPGASVTVAFALNTIPLTGPSSATMNVDLTSSVGNTTTLDGTTGVRDFTVGGQLTVAAAQTAGAYTGTMNVTVLYQ
jgi:hypothetical protein